MKTIPNTSRILVQLFQALIYLSVFFGGSAQAQFGDSDVIIIKFTNGNIFTVTNENFNIKLDLEGFEQTYDGVPNDAVILTAGNAERRMITQVTFDTLYSDLDYNAEEYHKLWWYFYSEDTTQHIGARRQWTKGKRHWSTFTIISTYGFEINEKHYDMFELTDTHSFHVSIKRPLYLEGDSTLMLSILESFAVIPPEGAPDKAKKSDK